MESKKTCDVCIVGGGVAGAALAGYLGGSSINVVVIEKNLTEQDRIVGELLQPGGVEMLERMGLQHLLDGFDAQPVTGYALFMNGENFQIAYPETNGKLNTGRGMRNGKFVQRLRDNMKLQQNVTVIEGSVTGLLEEEGRIKGVTYKTKGEDETLCLNAKLTVVSDGIFSVFRNQLSNPQKKVSGHFLGLVLKNCELPYPNHGHVIVAKPSPVLVYPITSTETRMLIDFPGEDAPRKGEELKNYLLNTIGNQLPSSIRNSFTEAVEGGKFKVMPNHIMAARPVMKEGGVLLGDSLNMRHPLTGGGMTVAFTDVYLLGKNLLEIADFSKSAEVSSAVAAFYKTRNSQTATINILADALYGVMRNEDLKEACFNYLKRGGSYSQEPVSILSAVSRDVKLLIRHFFAVAVYGVKNILSPFPNGKRLMRSYNMLKDSVSIIVPLLRNEGFTDVNRLRAKL
ncbi:MAG: FAD-dependent monooxygenase [Chitinophagales bacterium]|nr:FAD-dependent monooxygenase [Chitinophagales bacterium]